MPINILRIDHVSLDVGDRPASLAWYQAVLGVRPHLRHEIPDEPVFLGPAGARLGLFADRSPGLRHVALATDASGQRELASRLKALAIPYQRERHRDSHSIYFRDPDGITLEVTVPTG
jgi:catechol 2,3-dioxygenase-like lactoylglutathione lyase family enzyme